MSRKSENTTLLASSSVFTVLGSDLFNGENAPVTMERINYFLS